MQQGDQACARGLHPKQGWHVLHELLFVGVVGQRRRWDGAGLGPCLPELTMFTLTDLERATALVRTVVPTTAFYAWPLLAHRTGAHVWVKHENHTPIGAFKVRGGVVYLDAVKRNGGRLNGVVTATRGNHGQSIALAAASAGLPCAI